MHMAALTRVRGWRPTLRAVAALLLAGIRALVFSSLWIAASVAALTAGCTALLGLEPDPGAALLLFCSTLFIYAFDHQLDARAPGAAPSPARAVVLHPASVALTVAAGLATLALVARADLATRLVFGAYAGSGVLYGLPCIPQRGPSGLRWLRLKDIPYTKGFVVSAAIAIGAVGIPAARASAAIAPLHLAGAGLLAFTLIVINTHLFDVPDLEEDRRCGVRTLASRLGLPGLRRLSGAAALFGALVACLTWTAAPAASVGFVVGIGASWAFALAVTARTPRLVYGTVLEALMGAPALMTALQAA